jgi:hypothetical protein
MKRFGFISTAFLLFLFATTSSGYAQRDQQGEKQDKQEEHAKPERQQGDKQAQPEHQRQETAQQQQDQGKQSRDEQRTNKPAQPQPEHTQERAPRQHQDQNKQPQQAQQQQQDQDKQQHAQQANKRSPQQSDHAQRQSVQQQKQQPERTRPVQVQRTQQQQHAQESAQQGAWQERRAHSWESEHRTWQQRGGYNGYRVSDVYFRSHYGQEHFFRVFSLPFLEVGGSPRFQYGGYWFTPVDPYPEFWGADWYQTDDVYLDYSDNGYYLYNRRYPGRPGIAISISL